METTLSLAIKPAIRATQILQSANPRGFRSGVRTPATAASMLSLESDTMFSRRLNVCRNQITSVAMKMTENALSTKSFALSHRSLATLAGVGMR